MQKTKLVKIRNRKMKTQNGCCYYCTQPMWIEGLSHFCSRYKLTQKQAENFQCTTEHLLARSDGGNNAADNIVAACKFCNWTRHRAKNPMRPEEYMKKVSSRMAAGKWHQKLPTQPHTATMYISAGFFGNDKKPRSGNLPLPLHRMKET